MLTRVDVALHGLRIDTLALLPDEARLAALAPRRPGGVRPPAPA